MRRLDGVLFAFACVGALGASLAQGQQQGPALPQSQQQAPDQSSQPIPAYHSPLASAADSGEVDSQQGMPDDRSLSGAQNLSPLLLPTRSYWQPGIDVSATVDSNPSGIGSNTNWSGGAVVSGRIDVHRISGVSAMDASYMGGASFSANNSFGTGVVQALGFSDRISFHRSNLSFFDQFTYLPGSSFGFGGLGGLPGGSLPGTGSNGLGPTFGPGGTVLIGEGQTLENSFVTQFDTSLTRRASLTLVGGYYFSHYFNSDLFNSGNPNFRLGYNYQLGHKDTIAAFYTFGGYGYGSSSTQSIHNNTAEFSYGRVVTQRISFQIAGGPQWISSQIPLTVNGQTTTVTSTTQLNYTLHASLGWLVGRNRVGISYYRGADAGSGVFAGSIGNSFTGSLTRAVSRTFSSGISGGYSRNTGVVTNTAGALVNQTYNSWYAGATLSHPIGTSLGLTLSYWFQHQNSSTASCVGPSCQASILTNVFSVGLGWHTRPLAF